MPLDFSIEPLSGRTTTLGKLQPLIDMRIRCLPGIEEWHTLEDEKLTKKR
jgi:hypothetical protein